MTSNPIDMAQCEATKQQSPLEGALKELGNSYALFEASHRIGRILNNLRGCHSEAASDNEKQREPDSILERAEINLQSRQYVVNKLHDQISELESLIGSR